VVSSLAIESRAVRQVLVGGLLFLTIVTIATVGYEFAGWSLLDALYMVIITIFGVGYGEVQPVDTVVLRLYTIFLIVGGYGAAIYAFGGVVKLVTEGEMRKMLHERRKEKEVADLTAHTIICGFGRIGQILAKDLATAGTPFVVLDRDSGRIELALERGFLARVGDATQEEDLTAVGVERAQVLATVLPDDALNVFITLTARQLNPHIHIIARGENPSTESKLSQAGANEVVLPAQICGTRIAHSITRPSSMAFLREAGAAVAHDLRMLGLETRDLDLCKLTQYVGQTVGDLQRQSEGSLLVLGVKNREGQFIASPPAEHPLQGEDQVAVVIQPDLVPEGLLDPPSRTVRQYRGTKL
jgi:voltage-gated potassium channel